MGAPQQGTPVGTTSCAHLPATVSNALAMPIFLELHGTWMATLSRTCTHGRARDFNRQGFRIVRRLAESGLQHTCDMLVFQVEQSPIYASWQHHLARGTSGLHTLRHRYVRSGHSHVMLQQDGLEAYLAPLQAVHKEVPNELHGLVQ